MCRLTQVWIQCYTTTLSNFIKCQSAAAAAHSGRFQELLLSTHSVHSRCRCRLSNLQRRPGFPQPSSPLLTEPSSNFPRHLLMSPTCEGLGFVQEQHGASGWKRRWALLCLPSSSCSPPLLLPKVCASLSRKSKLQTLPSRIKKNKKETTTRL